MMVFGDTKFTATLQVLLDRIRECARVTNAESLGELRALLIQIGQLEQAVSDCPQFVGGELKKHFQTITDHAARAFLSAFAQNSNIHLQTHFHVQDELNSVREQLHQHVSENAELRIKIPEGYEFYTLYPEQYCMSAIRWIADHASAKSVVVIGIRSIGTSLSAIVAAVLNAARIPVVRLTLRPAGHPYNRTVLLDGTAFVKNQHALVVDDGPGMSGSSMAAVAEALVARGIIRKNISFFPGHEKPPGSFASEDIRYWWKSTPRYFTPLDQVQWNDESLQQLLLEKSSQLSAGEFIEAHDLGAGHWRKFAYKNELAWPAANIPFERTKYLCRDRCGRGVFWKFNGLGSLYESRDFHPYRRSTAVAIPPSLGSCNGFVATQWIEGTRLNCISATPDVLKKVAEYLSHSSSELLSRQDLECSIDRLGEMLRHNFQEAFPNETLENIDPMIDSARSFFANNSKDFLAQRSGAGHNAPHEWICTPDQSIFKTDSSGHDVDHTLIGKQPMLWDIAGIIVEWKLAPETAGKLFKQFQATGTKVDAPALRFFQASYAAFKMGQSFLCADMLGQNHSEHERLLRAAIFYQRQLAELFTPQCSRRSHHSTETPALHNR